MSGSSIVWVTVWGALVLVGLAGIAASANSMRFQRRVNGEVRWTLAAGHRGAIDTFEMESLPIPVRRYLARAVGTRTHAAGTLRLQHDGSFRPDLDGKWYPILGRQYFTADPPGFIWWGRVRLAPGLWIDARDRSIGGAGNMLVMAESTVRLADAVGPELDQGALLRLLGELAWLPTVYLDRRYIQWAAVDDHRATASLTVAGRTVSALFEFGGDGLPRIFKAERFRDVGTGQSALTPFVGECSDYREVDGLLVPHQMVGSWVIDGTLKPYARFRVVRMEYDVSDPF